MQRRHIDGSKASKDLQRCAKEGWRMNSAFPQPDGMRFAFPFSGRGGVKWAGIRQYRCNFA